MDTTVCQESALIDALSAPRYEVVPLSSVFNELGSLPDGAKVTITCSPKLGLSRTVEVAEVLAGRGFRPVPHLAARQVADRAHLDSIMERLERAGIDDVLVLGGDVSPPRGEFGSALELLQAIDESDATISERGIGGYPEGHPLLNDAELRRVMTAKAPYATYIVTQMCFSSDPLYQWVSSLRAQGVTLPVWIGIPGRVSRKRLLTMATRVGVGDSLRFLKRGRGDFVRMMFSSDYDPSQLVSELGPLLAADIGVAGLHVYTFNSLGPTETWRLKMIEQSGRFSR